MELLETIHYASGILGGTLLALIAILIYKKGKDNFRAKIFLKHAQFKTALLAIIIGTFVFSLGNVLEGIFKNTFTLFHYLGEIVFNISLMVFAVLIFNIIKIGEK